LILSVLIRNLILQFQKSECNRSPSFKYHKTARGKYGQYQKTARGIYGKGIIKITKKSLWEEQTGDVHSLISIKPCLMYLLIVCDLHSLIQHPVSI
jgi:hypothetical protein